MRTSSLLSRLLVAAVVVTLCRTCLGEQVQTGKIMAGTRYETTYYVKTAEQPGPRITIIGGPHGDETAGYLAADKLVKWKVLSGTLTVLPRAHVEAIRRNTRGYPGNMNAMFPGDKNGDDMHRLAYGIWQMVKYSKPSLLVTLHESIGLHRDEPTHYGQTLTYDFDDETPHMQRILARVNADIPTTRDQFLTYVYPVSGCPTYQAHKYLGIPATSIETSRKLPLQTRIKYQLMTIEAFLDEAGMQYEQTDVPRLSTAGHPGGAANSAVGGLDVGGGPGVATTPQAPVTPSPTVAPPPGSATASAPQPAPTEGGFLALGIGMIIVGAATITWQIARLRRMHKAGVAEATGPVAN